MKITIWSDFVCPFCYIGEAHLSRAIEQFAEEVDIEIEYNSFQLDPEGYHIPGLNYVETFAKLKRRQVSVAESMMERIETMAAAADLPMNMSEAVYSNTLNAHRLFQLYKEHGLGNDYFQRFYQAYFVENENIEDKGTIKRLALEVGLSEEAVDSVLKDNNTKKEFVEVDLLQAEKIGIQGVPFYVFNQKYGISGAHPVDAFVQVLEKVWEDEQKEVQ